MICFEPFFAQVMHAWLNWAKQRVKWKMKSAPHWNWTVDLSIDPYIYQVWILNELVSKDETYTGDTENVLSAVAVVAAKPGQIQSIPNSLQDIWSCTSTVEYALPASVRNYMLDFLKYRSVFMFNLIYTI